MSILIIIFLDCTLDLTLLDLIYLLRLQNNLKNLIQCYVNTFFEDIKVDCAIKEICKRF